MLDTFATDTLGQSTTESNGDGRIATTNSDLAGIAEEQLFVGLGVVVNQGVVDKGNNIAMMETFIEHHVGILETIGGIVHGQFVFAPVGKDDAIKHQCCDKVYQHTTTDDAKTLPSGFGAVLPRLGFRCQVFLILGLVNHACNVAIATEGNPTEAPKSVILIFGTEVLLVPTLGCFSIEEAEMPLAIKFLGLYEGEFPVKENIVPTHARAKQLGEKEVTKFMGGNKEGKTENEC